MTRVSVVMAVLNGATTVSRAIESVLGQDYEGGFELIVVDDGSTDSTPEVLGGYRDRIRTVRQENRGPAAARNAGAAVARGEYLAFLDADDVWMPRKLSRTVPVLEREGGVVLVFCDALGVNERDEVVTPSIVPARKARAPSMADMLSGWWPILPSTAVMRGAVFEACGGFCEELRSYEDLYLFLLAREHGEFRYIAEPLVRYRLEPVAERMERYEPWHEIFISRVRERYGGAAAPLIRATRGAYVSALGYRGVSAMRRGDLAGARRDFIRALRHDPLSVRTGLRLLRTFLPSGLARTLSGGTRHTS